MNCYETRRNKLRRLLKRSKAEALLVTNFTNVTYLTGFTGDDSYLLVWDDGQRVLSDPRYTTQLEEECPSLDLHIRDPGVPMIDALKKLVMRAKLGHVGIEADSMTVATHRKLAKDLPQVELSPCMGWVAQLRQIKDRQEIQAIRQAIHYAERAFSVIRSSLRGDQTELDVAHALEQQIRLFGGAGCSFAPIVAVGPRAALPHATPTDRRIDQSGFVLIDWGATGPTGYRSDLTRVLVTGKISPKLERIYRVVLDAQERSIAAIRPGVLASDVDAIARKTIADAGFGKYFGHGLGHGIGLDVHEGPRLGATASDVLRAGMVVTSEPGIYLPGFGGVRIEDDVLVTRDGHETLTSVPKQWEDAAVTF